jgi:hypothetical protein
MAKQKPAKPRTRQGLKQRMIEARKGLPEADANAMEDLAYELWDRANALHLEANALKDRADALLKRLGVIA